LTASGLCVGTSPTRADHPAPASRAAKKVKPFEFPEDEPARVRKSFADWTDAELQLFGMALGYMRNGSRANPLPVDSPLQWDQFALTHAQHCTEADQGHGPQVHWSWFFLPWHRAYLFFVERTLAFFLTKFLGRKGETFALPYWDWESHKSVPNTRERQQASPPRPTPFFGYDLSVDSLSDTVPFDNLAFQDGYRGPTRERPEMKPENEQGPVWKQHTRLTAFYTDPVYIASILRFPFDVFAGGRVISRDDGQGLLEQFPHNLVHDWVGSRYGTNRDMGTLRYAALDPLFYLHHANIDRIWSLYPYTPDPESVPEWGNQEFVFTDLDGQPVSVTVTQIIKKMSGVRYAPPQAPTPGARAFLAGAPRLPRRPPVGTTETVIPGSVTLTRGPQTLTASKPRPAVATLLSRGAAPEREVPSLLEFEVGPIEYSGRFTVRVFVNKPDATDATSVTDPHFVGLINALDSHVSEQRGKGREEPSHKFRINVSRDVSNFYNVVSPEKGFTLTLVPVGTEATLRNFRLKVKSVKLQVYQ
jgi:polyphenol oxidase